MPGFPDAPFPNKPFYSCDANGLEVIDQADMSELLRGGEVEKWMRLETGPGNVIDGAPVKIENQQGARVSVQCETGTIEIEFVMRLQAAITNGLETKGFPFEIGIEM